MADSLKHVDFIIVGQGLAGALLAYELLKAGKKILVIDEDKTFTSSKIAAGIIVPITGRRMVKTWKADTLIPFAKKIYHELETEFNEKIFYDLLLLELFSSSKNRNDWVARSAEQGFEKYINEEIHADFLKNNFNVAFGAITINQSGFLNISKLLDLFKKYFKNKNILEAAVFSIDDLKIEKERVEWKNFTATKIIFCEGFSATGNPFFSHLPFLPAKGEILEIYSEELSQDYIINHGMFILPLGNHHFKAGSTYQWDFKNVEPSVEGKKQIDLFLKKILKVDYEITNHYAAIRPTVQDRRPFIGLHPENPSVGIFNGLGTKGVMLAPFFAKQFVDFLEGKTIIDPEADIKRYHL
ncbi:MAG: FAD-dependent oxidoreductase [Bacteroidia bacterium]